MDDQMPSVGRPRGAAWRSLEAEGIVWEGQVLIVGGEIDLAARLIVTDVRLAFVRGGDIVLDVLREWLYPAPRLQFDGLIALSVTPEDDTGDEIIVEVLDGREESAYLTGLLSATIRQTDPRPSSSNDEWLGSIADSDGIWSQHETTLPQYDAEPVAEPPETPLAFHVSGPVAERWETAGSPSSVTLLDGDDFPPIVSSTNKQANGKGGRDSSSLPLWGKRETSNSSPTSSPQWTTSSDGDLPRNMSWLQPIDLPRSRSRRTGWVIRLSGLVLLLIAAAAFGAGRLPDNAGHDLAGRLPASTRDAFGWGATETPIPPTPTAPSLASDSFTPTATAPSIVAGEIDTTGDDHARPTVPSLPTAIALGVGGELTVLPTPASSASSASPNSSTPVPEDERGTPTTIGSVEISGNVHAAAITPSPPTTLTPPLPTMTVVPTATATNTPVPTATLIPTATNTPVPTATATATATTIPTATNTPVPSATATATTIPTATNTPVPTATATATTIPTATNTPIPTATIAATATVIPTATSTPVPTATSTPMATATMTSTAVPTNTPPATAVPTNTPIPTATMVPIPTPTPGKLPPQVASVGSDQEPKPVAVEGKIRYTIESAVRGAELPDLALPATDDGDWVVLIVNAHNWSDQETVMHMSDFKLLALEPIPATIMVDAASPAIAQFLGITPAYKANEDVQFAPEQDQNVVLAFLVDPDVTLLQFQIGTTVMNINPTEDDSTEGVFDGSNTLPSVELLQGTVLDVLDGQTIRVQIDGEQGFVQYSGIAAPVGDACYALQATNANLKLVAGKTVWLERQRFNTAGDNILARDVWVENDDGDRVLVAQVLVAQGAAVPEIRRPDTRFADWLDATAKNAETKGSGVWGACNGRGNG